LKAALYFTIITATITIDEITIIALMNNQNSITTDLLAY
jgi:hypothetical protein